MTFHLSEASLPKPFHLLIQASEPVGWIVLNPADLIAKTLVEARRCRAHEVEIGKDSAGGEAIEDFREQPSLTDVLEMMNREAGDERIHCLIER